jgi:hypothetical protein
MKSISATLCMVTEVVVIIAAVKVINYPFSSSAAQWFLSSVAILAIGLCGKKLFDSVFNRK